MSSVSVSFNSQVVYITSPIILWVKCMFPKPLRLYWKTRVLFLWRRARHISRYPLYYLEGLPVKKEIFTGVYSWFFEGFGRKEPKQFAHTEQISILRELGFEFRNPKYYSMHSCNAYVWNFNGCWGISERPQSQGSPSKFKSYYFVA